MNQRYIQLDPDYPEVWELLPIKRMLTQGAMGVIPTDTVYAFVCDVADRDAVERLYRIKGLTPKKPLSILCRDVRMVATYTRGLNTNHFRAMKRSLPGPFTFILNASREMIPRTTIRKRKQVGVRIPDDPICETLLEDAERPLLCTSVRTEDDSFWNNPAQISETFGNQLDFVVDGGQRLAEPSTVIDLTGRDPEVIRHGKGDADLFL